MNSSPGGAELVETDSSPSDSQSSFWFGSSVDLNVALNQIPNPTKTFASQLTQYAQLTGGLFSVPQISTYQAKVPHSRDFAKPYDKLGQPDTSQQPYLYQQSIPLGSSTSQLSCLLFSPSTSPHQTSKYSQLLAVLEEIGKDIRPSYAGSKSSSERLKRGIIHARILVREALVETERSARQ